MEEARALGRAIESEMVANGISRKEFAEAVGVSEATVGEYLRGEREPSLGKLRGFASKLRCSVGYLIGRQEQIMGWERSQSIAGDANVQVSGVTAGAGDTTAGDQSVTMAGATVFGDVVVQLPEDA